MSSDNITEVILACCYNGSCPITSNRYSSAISTLMMVGVVTIPVEIKYFGKRISILRNGLAFIFSFIVALVIGMVVMQMIKWIKRYRIFLIVLIAMVTLTIFNRKLELKALSITGNQVKEMLRIIPPIFVLLGLLDVWVPRETMVKYMGEGSGLKGILLAIFIGSATAGPLYGAFPVAAVFMKKGVKFMNILIFIGAWSTTKIPMFLFEMAALGSKFAIARLLIDIPGIIIIALILSKMISKNEVEALYENAKEINQLHKYGWL